MKMHRRRARCVQPIFSLLFVVLWPCLSYAVYPLEVYEKRVEASAIKAFAVVESIRVTGKNKWTYSKEVTFRLERAIGGTSVPEKFKGTCQSARFGKTPPAGGERYIYPNRGEHVFVAVDENGGSITAYEVLTGPVRKKILAKYGSTVEVNYTTTHTKIKISRDVLRYESMPPAESGFGYAYHETTEVRLSKAQLKQVEEWLEKHRVLDFPKPVSGGDPDSFPACFHYRLEVVSGDRRRIVEWTGASGWANEKQFRHKEEATEALEKLYAKLLKEGKVIFSSRNDSPSTGTSTSGLGGMSSKASGLGGTSTKAPKGTEQTGSGLGGSDTKD